MIKDVELDGAQTCEMGQEGRVIPVSRGAVKKFITVERNSVIVILRGGFAAVPFRWWLHY